MYQLNTTNETDKYREREIQQRRIEGIKERMGNLPPS